MSSEIITVTPETLPTIMWQNQPVITTELLAEIYGTVTDNISQNFTRNAARFIEGVHYFLLKGADLKALKTNLLKEGQLQIGKRAGQLYLWTERGTVRHAKILDTDNAWAVQDRLEDFYFTKNQPKPYGLVELESINKTQWGILSAIVADIAESNLKEGATKAALWSRFSKHFKIASYKELPAIKFDDALVYLEEKRLQYNQGFALVQVKRDDLITLGYDAETKAFQSKTPALTVLPTSGEVIEMPKMISIDVAELESLRKVAKESTDFIDFAKIMNNANLTVVLKSKLNDLQTLVTALTQFAD